MKYSVIIADDMKFIRDDLKTRLAMAPDIEFQVIAEAADGKQAISEYFRLKPDLLLLDLILPLASGLDVAREILSHDPRARICLIAAMGHEPFIQQALDLGVMDFLIKPFETETIHRRITRMLRP